MNVEAERKATVSGGGRKGKAEIKRRCLDSVSSRGT